MFLSIKSVTSPPKVLPATWSCERVAPHKFGSGWPTLLLQGAPSFASFAKGGRNNGTLEELLVEAAGVAFHHFA